MKLLAAIFMFAALLVFLPVKAYAAPFNAEDTNPNKVAFYDSGDHGVVPEPATHSGTDMVMAAGKSGNFQQWFYGTTTESGVTKEGDHSVWKFVGTDTSCPSGWTLVPNPNPAWGDYLLPGNYCVNTNDFHVTK